MIEIGHDVVAEILVQLPVKSLMRFKCVDRTWNDLFKTPTFVIKNRKMHEKKKKECLMILENEKPPRVMISENDEEVELEGQHQFQDHHVSWNTEVWGCYNGVFCIKSENLFLWNPTTGELKLLPPPPFLHPPPSPSIYFNSICGFGGDPDTNDFKILYIFSISEQILNERIHDPWEEGVDIFRYPIRYLPPSIELYNLSTNSWTLMDNLQLPVKFEICIPNEGTLVNRVRHWLCTPEEEEEEEEGEGGCILCFDFRNNQFTRLDLPPQTFNYQNTLVEVNDSLAYVHLRQLPQTWNSAADIWILEQDTCCWTKKYIFEPLHCHVTVYHFWKDAPELLASCRRDNGELYLASYNSDGQIMRHFEQVSLHDKLICHPLHKYVQSIAPLSFS